MVDIVLELRVVDTVPVPQGVDIALGLPVVNIDQVLLVVDIAQGLPVVDIDQVLPVVDTVLELLVVDIDQEQVQLQLQVEEDNSLVGTFVDYSYLVTYKYKTINC